MNMRLAYRVISMQPMVLPPVAEAYPDVEGELTVQEYARKRGSVVRHATCVVLDNVAKFYAENAKTDWDIMELPNWAPPWTLSFMEWDHPRRWYMKNGWHESEEVGQYGMTVASLRHPHGVQDSKAWRTIITGYAGSGSVEMTGDYTSRIEPLLAKASWTLFCDHWLTCLGAPIYGAPVWMGIYTIILADESGKCLGTFDTGPGHASWSEKAAAEAATGHGDDPTGLASSAHILGLGYSFCHCKNVVTSHIQFNRSETWHRKQKIPKLKFQTLEINPMQEVLKTEGGIEANGVQRAMHICRGHFAHYTEQKPLFGKHHGDFWIPQHVRGKKELGEVVKDYAINPGDRN
jgi:hypothetical protein